MLLRNNKEKTASAKPSPRLAPAHLVAPDFSLENIPPRPSLLMALQREIRKDNPDTRRYADLIRRDVAMTGTLLQIANSAYFSVGRRISTIEDAIVLLGLNQCNAIMSGLILRKSLNPGNQMMARFWEGSEKRAIGVSMLAKRTRNVSQDVAYTFGLFCDAGIPLLRAACPSYLETLVQANLKASGEFLRVENERHGTNHAIVGALLAERWSLGTEIVLAIRMHHSYQVLFDKNCSPVVRTLIALNCVVEKALQEYRGQTGSLEWVAAGLHASKALRISHREVDNLCEALITRFRA
jgi:HD-like signal output (HDOD) protein